MKPPSFFAELKRRNVYRIAVAYAVAAWLLIQVSSILLITTFQAPAWVMKVVVAVIFLGFPVALVLAWAFEITPEGIKWEKDVKPGKSIGRRTGRKLVGVTVMLGAIAAGLFVFRLLRPQPETDIANELEHTIGSRLPIAEKSIAVLPFENLSDDKSNAYFADGIQDEILTKLARVADLKVISRTSSASYKSKPQDLKSVAQQLGVAHILEGSVQRAADKVRVNVQLIDARADGHLWADTYDREIKDVFAVESEISQKIASALQAKLSPNEASGLTTAPTQDPEAYDLFLKGEYAEQEAENVLKAEPFNRAAGFYEQALARDPNFALAAARLAENRVRRHWFIGRLSDAQLHGAKSLAERAIVLAPDLAEAYIGLGTFHYFGKRAYEEALKQLQHALELQPNNVRALELSAYIHRRQGQWERALSEMAKCEARDPRNPHWWETSGRLIAVCACGKMRDAPGCALWLSIHTVFSDCKPQSSLRLMEAAILIGRKKS
jgi:TolB-like protein